MSPSYISMYIKQYVYKVFHCTIVYKSKDRMSVTIKLRSRYFLSETDIYVQI